MYKSKTFQCSTGSLTNPLDMTHDKIQDLKTEENFISRLKKQKEKMEVLNSEFQQQDTLIVEQEQLIKTLTASNNQLKSSLEEYSQRLQSLELECSQKTDLIYTLESNYQKVSNQLIRTREAYGAEKSLAKESQIKLVEQENTYSKNYENLRMSTKTIEKETQVLKEKYRSKTEETNELVKSLQLAQKTIIKLHQQIKKLEIENQHIIQKFEENSDDQARQIHSFKLENESLKSKTNSQSKQLSELQYTTKSLNKQLEEVTATAEDRGAKMVKLDDHLRNCLEQIRALEEDVYNRDHLINDLSSKKQSNTKYKTIKRELLSIRERQCAELDELIENVRIRHR